MSPQDRIDLLAELTRRTSLTDADFASLIGYSRYTMTNLLTGKYPIKPELLSRAAEMSERAVHALRPLRTLSRYDHYDRAEQSQNSRKKRYRYPR